MKLEQTNPPPITICRGVTTLILLLVCMRVCLCVKYVGNAYSTSKYKVVLEERYILMMV